jgi:NAD(P)H-dependent flavin oxidoreductase YrpB (nitropropane dioxygenase family)
MAGGHLGFKEEQINDMDYSLEKLVPEIVAELKKFEDKYNIKIPLIAAGGIYTGEDIHNILNLGASGVQMGTRFVTTEECDASPAFKQAYINAVKSDIEIIKSPVGMPGRAILSNFITKVRDGKKQPKVCPFKCIKTCDISKSPYCIIIALINALKGNFENGYAFAGSNAFRATKISSVKEIFQTLLKEYRESK